MNNENTPPWDTNRQIQNPIDKANTFKPIQDIFSISTIQQNTKEVQKTQIKEAEGTKIGENHENTNKTEKKDLSMNANQFSQTKCTENGEANQNPPAQKQEIKIQNENSVKKNIQTQETESKTQNETAKHNDSTEAVALALKYRPKTFSELIGQESVARTLCLALDSKKIANAYLFSGLRGSGKTSSARILARSLQCEKGITSSPCGNCPNCVAALKGAHLDIIELDGASNRKIDDIRDLIEQTRYKPTMGRFKVFIIDEVHMLTKEAFNSLLKTLEEPPGYVKFILATTDPLKVPSTILSRTQHFRFKKIPTSTLKNHLAHILQRENVIADNESLDMIIRNGHGSVRDTLTLLDQAIVFCQSELTTQKLADMLGALDPKAFDVLFQALLSKNMQTCIQFARSLDGYEIEMILDELSLYIKNKMLEEIPQIPPVLGMRYANIINDSKAMLQLDCDSEFCLLLTILKMLEAQKIREIAHAIKQLEETKGMAEQIEQLSQNHEDTTQNMQSKQNQANLATPNIKEQGQTREEVKEGTQRHIMQPNTNENEAKKEVKEQTEERQNLETGQNSRDSVEFENTKNYGNYKESEKLESQNIKYCDNGINDNLDSKNSVVSKSMDSSNSLNSKNLEINDKKSDESNMPNTQMEITKKIESFEKTESYGQIGTTKTESIKAESINQKMQEKIREMEERAEITEQPKKLTQNNNLDSLFTTLMGKLYERDYTIGNIFENKVIYEKLEGETIYLTFYLTQDELGLLRQGYSGIMQVMKEVYGDSIKMQVEKREPQELAYKNTLNHKNTETETINEVKNENNKDIASKENNEWQQKLQMQNPEMQESIMQNYDNTDTKDSKISQNIQENDKKEEQNEQQKEVQNDPAINFITKHSEMVKSMKNELGIKEVKILSLDIF